MIILQLWLFVVISNSQDLFITLKNDPLTHRHGSNYKDVSREGWKLEYALGLNDVIAHKVKVFQEMKRLEEISAETKLLSYKIGI